VAPFLQKCAKAKRNPKAADKDDAGNSTLSADYFESSDGMDKFQGDDESIMEEFNLDEEVSIKYLVHAS
jgi:hypothetical protein